MSGTQLMSTPFASPTGTSVHQSVEQLQHMLKEKRPASTAALTVPTTSSPLQLRPQAQLAPAPGLS